MKRGSYKYQIPFRVGTIAHYGRDNETASKMVAGITLNGEVIEIKKWFQEIGDIRNNLKFAEEITEFFKARGYLNYISQFILPLKKSEKY